MITGGHVYKQGVNTSNKDWYLVKEYNTDYRCRYFIPITFEDILSDMFDSPKEKQMIYLVIKDPEDKKKTEYSFRFDNSGEQYRYCDINDLSNRNKNLLFGKENTDNSYNKDYSYVLNYKTPDVYWEKFEYIIWPEQKKKRIDELNKIAKDALNNVRNRNYNNNNRSDGNGTRGTTGDATASFISFFTNGGASEFELESSVEWLIGQNRAHEINFFMKNRFYGYDPVIVINNPYSIYVFDQKYDNKVIYKWNENNNFESQRNLTNIVDRYEFKPSNQRRFNDIVKKLDKEQTDKHEWQKYFIEMKEEFEKYLKKYEIGIDNMNKTTWKDVGKDPEKDPEKDHEPKSFLNSIWKSLRRSKNLEPTTNQSTTSKGGKKLKKSRKPVKKQRKTRKNKK
jgi:hypothetical protein